MAKISIPENNISNLDVIYIFTNSKLVNLQYMVENTPYKITQKNVVVFLEQFETYEIAKTKLNILFSELNLTIKSESIIGINTGAINALGSFYYTNIGFINPNTFSFIGLVDPLLKNNFLTLNFGNNTNILYNTKNWPKNPFNQKLQKKLANQLTSTIQKEEKDLTLLKLIDYFFTKYLSNLT